MVNAGVHLVARLHPVLGGSRVALCDAVAGAAIDAHRRAPRAAQRDLKRLLAYSTVSALGTLMPLLGLGTALAAQAAMLFLVVHSSLRGRSS
jgi:multicomponent Na+:H+ antiporter subunit A